MPQIHTQYTSGKIEAMVRSLPGILSGERPDKYGLRAGIAARMAFTFLSLVRPNFNKLGRGQPGAGGEKWAPLSAAYLAYTRPKSSDSRKPLAGGLWPGGKDGFMSKGELKKWQSDFGRIQRSLLKKYGKEKARGVAAAMATAIYKRNGGKVKISDPGFGGRQPGSYQTLVDRGQLRNSITAGELVQRSGYNAKYEKTDENQVYEVSPGVVIVGTRDPKAAWHHNGKGRRKRRLWPAELPSDWVRQISDSLTRGLATLGNLVAERKL